MVSFPIINVIAEVVSQVGPDSKVKEESKRKTRFVFPYLGFEKLDRSSSIHVEA